MKSQHVTTQMKATERYFPVELFIMLYKVVLTFESVGHILSVTTEITAIEQYFGNGVYCYVEDGSNF